MSLPGIDTVCHPVGAAYGVIADHTVRTQRAIKTFVKDHERRDEIEQQLNRSVEAVSILNERTIPTTQEHLSKHLPRASQLLQESSQLLQSILEREGTHRQRRSERAAQRQARLAPEREALEAQWKLERERVDEAFARDAAAMKADYEAMGVVFES